MGRDRVFQGYQHLVRQVRQQHLLPVYDLVGIAEDTQPGNAGDPVPEPADQRLDRIVDPQPVVVDLVARVPFFPAPPARPPPTGVGAARSAASSHRGWSTWWPTAEMMGTREL